MPTPTQSDLGVFIQSPKKARGTADVETDLYLMSSGDEGLVYVHNPVDLSRVIGPLDFRGVLPELRYGVFNSNITRFYFLAPDGIGGDRIACIDFTGTQIWITSPTISPYGITGLASDGEYLYTVLLDQTAADDRPLTLQKRSISNGSVVSDVEVAVQGKYWGGLPSMAATVTIRSDIVYCLALIPDSNSSYTQVLRSYSAGSLTKLSERDLGNTQVLSPTGDAYFELGPGALSVYLVTRANAFDFLVPTGWKSVSPSSLADAPYDWTKQAGTYFSPPAATTTDVTLAETDGPFRFENLLGGVGKYSDDETLIRQTGSLNGAGENIALQPATLPTGYGIDQVSDASLADDATSYSQQITWTGADPGAWSLVEPPTGFTIDADGLIESSGPFVAGDYFLRVYATTGASNWQMMSYALNIFTPGPPVINPISNFFGTNGAAYSIQPTLASGTATLWEFVSNPVGATIDANTGFVEWVIADGIALFEIRASSGALSDTEDWFVIGNA